MMGRQNNDQGPLFYEFCVDEAVPDDHLARKIDAVLDLSWVHAELAPHYPTLGRPSIDPVLMIRMLIIGYVFALRSERLLCREMQVNLAYRWFCKLGIEQLALIAPLPTHHGKPPPLKAAARRNHCWPKITSPFSTPSAKSRNQRQ
jgi:transposase